MFRELITRLFANNILTGLGKIILISTVGVTTTSAAYLYGNISNPLFNYDEVETDETNAILITNQIDQTDYLDETKTSTSKTIESTQDTNFNEFVVDIVSSASKLITGTVNGFDRTIQTTDVKTSTSKQNTPDTIGTITLPIEDTNTGSSRTVSVGGTLISISDEDENEYEEVEDENEYEDDEIENEDEEDEEDDEDEDDVDDKDEDDEDDDDEEDEDDKDEDEDEEDKD